MKKTTKKVVRIVKAKASVKKASAPVRSKKTGLRMFQVRTLKALLQKDSQSTFMISQRAGVSPKFIILAIGPVEEAARKAADEKNGFPSLLTLKHVRIVSSEGRANHYSITPTGKVAFAKYVEEHGKTLPAKASNGQ